MGQNPDFAGTPSKYMWKDSASGILMPSGKISIAKPGILYSVHFQNGSAGVRYLMIWDATAVPADADKDWVVLLEAAAGKDAFRDYSTGLIFDKGIVWAVSSTSPAKTIGAADAKVIITADP